MSFQSRASLRSFTALAIGLCLPALLALGAAPRAAAATTYYVSPSGSDNNAGTQAAPFKTIQQGINNAATGDTVSLAAGTYTGLGDVDLDTAGNSITVISQSGPSTTIIDCAGTSSANHRGFYFHTNEAKAVVSGLTLKNGYEANTGGAVDIESGSSVTLTNCTFTGSVAGGSGGTSGGGVFNGGMVTLTGCTLSGDTADNVGGGLANSGTAALTNCTISANTNDGLFNTGTMTATGCSINSNTGPGVYNQRATATLTSCTLSKNTTGLAVENSYNNNAFTTALSNCTLTDNTASGVTVTEDYAGSGILTMTGCAVTGNSASGNGGGISITSDGYQSGNTTTLTRCTVTGNTASSNGGGISNEAGGYGYSALTLTGCTVSGNTATVGGGLFITTRSSVNLSSSVLDGNTASGNGGGVDNGSTLMLTNCLLSGNTNSAGNGGGLDNEASGTATLQFCTLSDNSTQAAGTQGGALENDGTATLTDDILYNNTAPYAGEIGVATSGNPSTTATYCDIEGGLSGTGNIHVDPSFVNPSDDYHLQSGSPCIGKGTPIMGVATDLDGTTRANPPSIGAYEGAAKAATKVTVANASGTAGQSVILSATLSATSGAALSGKTLTLTVDGASGTATTNSSGTASLSYTIPSTDSTGSHTITVSFAGDSTNAASSGAGTLTVSAVTYPYQVRYFPRVGNESRMVGGLFQGSNDNTTWTTLYTVTATPGDAYTTAALTVDPATFRYLRYLAPNGSYGNVAEIEFDSHGTKLTGVAVFGTPGSYNNDGYTFQNALDGNTSTYFDAPAPGNGDFFGIDRGATGPTYTKLTGTDYGTSGSYDNDGLTFQNAFDGNLNTYFDAPAPGNGDTVGIDLGASNQKVVTRIDFCPRSGYASRMVGGVFQGSNGHGVWTNLYTVSSAPASDVLTRVTISNSTAYRYLQYVAPNGSYGNVAEVEFDTSP